MEGIVLVFFVYVYVGFFHKEPTDDSGERRQKSKDGDPQTCPTHTDGGAKRIGTIRYNSLQDDVYDTRDEEQQSSYVMNHWHCYFLEGCNNGHAQTGEQPNHESSFTETRAHHPCVLILLLHKLVPGIYGGYSCTCSDECHQAKYAALWGECTGVTDIWKDDVNIMSVKRYDVGNNEGAGGPDDQKHW